MKVVHTGVVVGGKLVPDNPHLLKEAIASLNECDVRIEISPMRGTRTQRMNRYYWGVLIANLVDFFNTEKTFGKAVDSELVHELLKVKFLGTKKVLIPGNEVIEVVNSSAKLSVEDFQDYCETIIAWAADTLNVSLPLPGEY